jgi:hypothetical protein
MNTAAAADTADTAAAAAAAAVPLQVWIEGSLSTNYPDLVSLFGLDQYDDGSAKYMGVSLRNSSNRPVPIQTVRSKIAELSGPDVPVQLGQAATFTWETQGYGEQFCYVDGQKVANTADLVSLFAWLGCVA